MAGVFIFYAIYVNVENAVLTPRIMQSSVDLMGLTVLVALLIGTALAGIVGALVAVPTAALIAVLLEEYAVQRLTTPEHVRGIRLSAVATLSAQPPPSPNPSAAPSSFPSCSPLAALAAAALIAITSSPPPRSTSPTSTPTSSPPSTIFKADSMVVGQHQTQDVLFVASTIRIDNQLRVPIFLDDFTCTFTNADGAQLHASALTKAELATPSSAFPQLKPIAHHAPAARNRHRPRQIRRGHRRLLPPHPKSHVGRPQSPPSSKSTSTTRTHQDIPP